MRTAGQIQQRTLHAAFAFDGDEWEIAFTPWSINDIQTATKTDRAEDLAALLASHITAWNLRDDSGAPFPVGEDWLLAVGLDYLRGLFEGLNEEMQVKKPTASASSGTLRRVV